MSKFCTQCGTQLTESDLFCRNCGAKQEPSVNMNENIPQSNFSETYSAPAPESQPQYYSAPQNYVPPVKQKKKGGALKILLVICIIIILILVGAVACLALAGNDEPSAPESSIIPESSLLPESEAPADVPAVESEAPAEEEYYSADSIDELVATLEEILASTSPDTIIYDEIYYKDGILYYNYCIEGVAEAVVGAKALGYDETFPAWVEYRESTVELFYSVDELLGTLGYPDLPLAMMVLNDENIENVFITIYEGMIIYDVMAE